jgi:APA family basic amino acid/polyamine antiporter
LRADERRPPRWIPVLGVLGCAVLAVSLPWVAAVTGAAVLVLGALLYPVLRARVTSSRDSG